MMNNLFSLYLGELERMKKYNIFGASFLISLIWIGVLYFSDIKDVTFIFPLLLVLDATSMAMLMVGVTMFFEKEEGTIKTLLVSPISKSEYIISKTLANVTSSVISLVILYLYARFFKEIDVNILGMVMAVILISFFHSLIGFILTYYSKDFTGLLMGMMKYSFVAMLPVIFVEVGLIKSKLVSNILYIVPVKSSLILLKASIGGVKNLEIFISAGYLIVVGVLLYYLVYKMFDQFAVKESGV